MDLKLNIGCGKNIRTGFVNCDIQKYPGVDRVMDCSTLSYFKDKSAGLIFADAFLEHLYQYQQGLFLRECKRVLQNNGLLLILNLPDFREIARLYYLRMPGEREFGGTFNLYQAYRLTHGDFENEEKESIPQLHKCLFDKESINKLFDYSGFNYFRTFNYKTPGARYEISMGAIAWKSDKLTEEQIKKELANFNDSFDDLNSLCVF